MGGSSPAVHENLRRLCEGQSVFSESEMKLMVNFSGLWDTIILLGIVQGGILVCLLYARRRQQPANRLLAALLMLIVMASLNMYLLDATWLDVNRWTTILANALPLVVVMPLGPLIWLYVQASIDPGFRVTRQHRRHCYPVIIDLFPYALVLAADLGKLATVVSPQQRKWVSDFIDQYEAYADIPRWVSVTVYCWLSYRYIVQRRRQQVETLPAGTARWLQQFLRLFLAFQAIWLVYLVPYIIPATRQQLLDAVDWYPIFVPLAVLIYWLGLKGYLLSYRSLSGQSVKMTVPVSKMPEAAAEPLIERLQAIMVSEKPYLDPSLSVNGLAQLAGVPAKTVSAVLNQHLGKSFSVFINEYRVETFKQRIRQEETDHLTIPGIALECGFPSTATFQRIFKQLTGTTPSQFIQEAKRASQVGEL